MRETTKLKPCELADCEALCCSDGVYLHEREETKIRELVTKHPEHFPDLPTEYIVKRPGRDGLISWTAVRSYQYRRKPAHFSNTRCVFAEHDGKCSLQTLAIAHGKHKWTYKPVVCWMFPLVPRKGGFVAPQREHENDPYRGDEYPGFQTYANCGVHRPDGRVWWIVLKEELRYYRDEPEESRPSVVYTDSLEP